MNPFEDIDPPTDEEIDEILDDVEQQKEEWDPLDLPESQAQLVKDIRAAGGPGEMISRVGAGVYHDYVSPLSMPKHQLVVDAQAYDLHEIAQRAKQGHYDP